MEIKTVLIRISIATLFGALIGLEREYRKKNAGFRTMILIAVGSALLTIISLELFSQFPGSSDPTRIISYIVSGIGFLGAGVIMKEGVNSVRGITTAAAIWMVAALGMSAGAGLFYIGAIAAVVSIVALFLLPKFEVKVSRLNEFVNYTIVVESADFLELLEQMVKTNGLRSYTTKRSKVDNGYKLTVSAYGRPKDHEKFSWLLIDSKQVISFDN